MKHIQTYLKKKNLKYAQAGNRTDVEMHSRTYFFSVNNNYFKNNKNQSSLNSYMDGVNKFF